MTVGLYFGSFNPIHVGHLILAESVRSRAKLDRVWFVVSPQNPFKDKASLAPATDRLAMVERAIEGNPGLDATNIEFSLPQPSYTIATLRALTAQHPGYRFCLLLGADSLASLPKWKEAEAILSGYELYVYPRLGTEVPPELLARPNVHWVAAPVLELSATSIRARLALGESVRYEVTQPVLDYIHYYGLYGAKG